VHVSAAAQEFYTRNHPLPRGAVLQICKEVAAAMTYVHSMNIIHRDLKVRPAALARPPRRRARLPAGGTRRPSAARLRGPRLRSGAAFP